MSQGILLREHKPSGRDSLDRIEWACIWKSIR